MTWGRLLLILIMFSTVGLALWLGGLAWRRRSLPGVTPFIGLMLAIATWTLTDAAQILTSSLAEKLAWNKLGYLAIVATPVCWLLFIKGQVRPDRAWSAWQQVLLWIIPAITVGMVFTNETHWLYYSSISLAETPIGPLAVYRYGPWAAVQSFYSYGLMAVGMIFLLDALRRMPHYRHPRLMALLVGTLIPLSGSAVYVLGFSPITGLDLTPPSFALAGLVYLWAIFRLELLQLMPTARAALVETMSDGMLVLDATGHIVDSNPAAERLLGCRRDALAGREIGQALAGWQDVAGSPPRTPLAGDQTVISADGSRYLEIRCSDLREPDGTTVGQLAILRDVTSQRQAEASLRESQRVYHTLLSNLPGMAYRCRNDYDWTMEFVSQGCLALTGYAPADLEQNRRVSYASLIHPEDRQAVWDQIQAALQAGRPFQLTYRIVAADGTEKWVWEQGRGVSDQEGRMVALEGFIADLTDRIRAEQAEREQRRFAEALREATIALNSTLDLNELFDRILEQVSRVIHYDAAVVYLIEGDIARAVRWRGADEEQAATLANQVWRIEDTPNMRAMRAMRQAVVISDTHATPSWIVLPETAWIASHASAPICSHDEVVGFLEVDSTRSGFYDQADGERLRAFADQAALAIQNARLFDETRRRAEQMAMLNRIGLAITAGLSMEQVLHTVYEQCRQLAAMDAFYIALYDEPTGKIHFPLFLDADKPVDAPEFNVHTQPGMAGTVIRQGKTIYIPDALDPQIQATYPITFLGATMRSYLGVPLILRDRVVGVLSAQHTQPAAYTPEQVSLFEMLATQAAIAIDHAQLYEMAQREKHYLEALIASTPGGIVVIDPEGRVKRWSPAAERIFGYTAAEALGRNIDLLIASGSPQMLREGTRLTATAFTADRVAHIVTQRMRKDGSLVDVEIYGTPEIVGTERGMILSYYDISELQAARQALERSNAELQQRLAELDRANAELQAQNAELDAFAHTVAHGLRSPLGNILGYADLLRWDAAEMTGAEVSDLALEIWQQGRRMRNIIDELLLLSSMRTEDVHLEPLDMADVVAAAQERLADLIARAEAEIHLPDTWPVALGYGPWIEEVWVNYLGNALTHAGPTPRIELGAEPWGEGMVRFWVRDNGPGVAPEIRPRLFTPFTRLSQVHASGYGLGLSIVQRIITRLGGEVGVESEPGRGSLFFFALPAVSQ